MCVFWTTVKGTTVRVQSAARTTRARRTREEMDLAPVVATSPSVIAVDSTMPPSLEKKKNAQVNDHT